MSHSLVNRLQRERTDDIQDLRCAATVNKFFTGIFKGLTVHSNWEARVGLKTVLGRLKYFFRLRGAVNPYYGFGSSSYTNIFEAFGFFWNTDSFTGYLENYLIWLEYFPTGIDATMAFFSYVTIIHTARIPSPLPLCVAKTGSTVVIIWTMNLPPSSH